MEKKIEEVLKPEQIAEQLGPFSPPQSFSFEPEFLSEVPRPIPAELRRGAHETKWSQGTYVAISMGLVCVGLSFFGFVKELGYYILPLGYLNWIGYGIVVLTLLARIIHHIRPGRYEYIRSGLPIIVRILQSGQQLGPYEVEDKDLKFLSLVEYKHPETNKSEYAVVSSPQIATTFSPENYTTLLEPGDYVTAVYLPGKLEKSLQIYGYLGLNPEVDFIRKKGKKIKEHVSLPKTLCVIALIVAVFCLLVVGLYTIEFRFPIDFNIGQFAVAVGGGGLLLAILALIVSLRKKGAEKETVKNLFTVFFVGAVGGAILTTILLTFANSVFDRSVPEFRDIEVVELWHETTNFLIRNYKIEYRELGQSDSRKCPSRLEHMLLFQETFAGVIEVRQGLFGWPWIRGIYPAVWVYQSQDGCIERLTEEKWRQIEQQTEKNTGVSVVSAAILKGSDEFLSISAKLQQHIQDNIAQQMEEEEKKSN